MGWQKRFKSIALDIQDSMPSTHRRASSIPPAHNGATSVPPTRNGASYAQSTHTGAIYAQSTHIGATSVQSTHTGSTSVQSNHNGANSEHEDTNFFDESEDNITLTSGQTSTVRHKSDGYWRVSLIDDNGTITQENLKVQDIWTLPIGKKVIVPASELGQPTDDGGGLLSGFMGNLACDFSKLPMSYATWLKVPQKYKDSLYNDIIKKKFHIVDTRMEKFIMQKIGRRWGGARNRLYHSFYDESLSLEENLPNRPGGVDLDQWIWFAQHQNDSKTLEMRKKNTENRKQQKYTYTGGSKSISRRKAEEEWKRGRPMSRGEMWTIVHKRQNGSYVNDAARVIGVSNLLNWRCGVHIKMFHTTRRRYAT